MSKFVDVNKDGVDDNQDVDQMKQGLSNFGKMNNEFFIPADKDETARSGLQLGLAADAIGKRMDSAFSKDMATFQSGLYKENSKFGADLQYDFDAKTRADEFGYGMRSMDKQFDLQDEFQNRQYGRNIAKGRADTENAASLQKNQGAVDNFKTEFEDNIRAKGEERDRSRSNKLARSF